MNLNPKGEYIVLIDKKETDKMDKEKNNNLTIEEEYSNYETQGYNKKEIIKMIAKNRNVNKNEIYQYFIDK